MKISSFVAIATSTALTLLSAVEAQQPLPGYTPITGPTGTPKQRMPVQVLARSYPDVYNMYMLALIAMQSKPETDSLSYYQISGIHGVPFIPWQETSVSSQDNTLGYCTHNSPLFSTWHRPYLSLFEQRLVQHAMYEASKFKGSEAARWKAAAQQLRLPYWDWAASDLQSRQPPQLTASTVSIRRAGAGGVPESVTVHNPLREYQFRDNTLRRRYFRQQFANSAFTRRQPANSRLTSSNMALVDSTMNQQYSSRRSQTYGLFTIPSFNEFSSTQDLANGAPNSWNSVESIHNLVHVSVGGQWGHMTSVPYSAFDPIFWLHHCNVDRLIAMYEAIYPNRKMAPQLGSSTFARTVGPNTLDTVDTPLAPFRHTNGRYLTSRDVDSASSTWLYGYEYPEVPRSFSGNPTGLSTFTKGRVNALYGRASQRKRASPVDHTRREWICHMTFDATQVAGSAEIQVYFSKPNTPSNVTSTPFSNAPSNVTSTPFSNTTLPKTVNGDYVGSCASFQDDTTKQLMTMNITGAVYLSDALLDAGCPSLEPKDVVPYLKENIKWVVKKGGQEVVPLDLVPSLKVGVSSAEVTYSEKDTVLPVYGSFETHYDITEHKQCGFTYKDQDLVDSKPAPPVSGSGQEEPQPEEPEPATTPYSTEVQAGITTIHVTSTTTVCPTAGCGPVTVAFTALYPSASLPPYSVY